MSGSTPAGRQLSNLQLRVISAVVLAALVLGVTWLGGLAFRGLMALMALAIFYEWSMLAAKTGGIGLKWGAAALLGIAMLALVLGFSAETVWLALAIGLALVFAFGLVAGGGRETAVSFAYAGASGASLALLRGSDTSGLLAILYLFAVVWATDIFAYFAGRAIGGPKLAPSISPGKTWSGAVGGTIAGVAAGAIFATAAGLPHVVALAAAALFLSIVSQIGDLFESAVKRRHGAKDSGTLIPGHGGVMDRVDGLVAAAIALYLVCAALGGLADPARALFAG